MTAKIKSINKSTGRQHKHKPKGISNREFEKVHWPYLPILVVVFLLISVVMQTGALGAAVRNPNSQVLAYATSMSVGGLLTSTNSARASNGVASLGLNNKLNAAAQAKANDMAARNYWSHNTPEGDPPWVFISAQGYSYIKAGENLATGFSNEQATVDGWMASPPHKANMLDPAFLEVGFGFANNANYTSAGGGPMTIIVAMYGQPVGAPEAAPIPPAPAPPSVPQNTKKASPPPAAPAPQPAPAAPAPAPPPPPEEPAPKELPRKEPAPVTTENKNSGVALSFRTSRAELAFASTPASEFGTGIAIFGVFAAIGFWISKHAISLRRSLVRGEAFVFKHPLIDIGLIVIAFLSYLLTQTAGHIL